MHISEEIGKKINIFRKKKGWTVQELGDAICKSKATVSKYEKGQISLDVDTLYDIAAALGVSPEQLLYYAPDPEPVRQEDAVPSFFQGTPSTAATTACRGASSKSAESRPTTRTRS